MQSRSEFRRPAAPPPAALHEPRAALLQTCASRFPQRLATEIIRHVHVEQCAPREFALDPHWPEVSEMTATRPFSSLGGVPRPEQRPRRLSLPAKTAAG